MSGLPAEFRQVLESAGLRPVDVALADWGYRHGGERCGALGLALASHAVGQGHTGLRLDEQATRPNGGEALMDGDAFRAGLAGNPLVTTPGYPAAPLVLDAGRLYLHRYREYEQRLAQRLHELLRAQPDPVDTAPLEPDGGLFSRDWIAAGEVNWQAVAAFVAQRHRFAVISGGPGTGKTFTVVRLILRTIDAALAAGARPPVIRLAAPTGKAAARMMASIQQGLEALQPTAEIRAHLPRTASTLHRLLRLRWGSVTPGHDRDRPIAADVVIVDEASMADLPLMSKLADAIPDGGRLILLGDRYQLASVESGAVLADLCAPAGVNAFSDAQRAAAGGLLAHAPEVAESGAPSMLSDHVVTLQTSHRFRADSPIGRLAAAVNAGDSADVETALADGGEEIHWLRGLDAPGVDALVQALADAYGALHEAADPAGALDALDRVRLLGATRVGPLGSETLNRRIAAALADRHGFDPTVHHYHGRPIIVRRNDPRARLYNGDVGVIWRDRQHRTRAWFRTEDGLRALRLSMLPDHATVYTMTIHKSQGSEFDTVYLVLPPDDSPVLTRELLYTGITRARRRLVVAADANALAAATGRRTARASALAERIVGESAESPGSERGMP